MFFYLNDNIKGLIVTSIYILLVFILAIPLYLIKPEYSRKEIHIMLGNFYFLALLYFTEWYFAFILPFTFIFVNYYLVKSKFIKLMERKDNQHNNSKIQKGYGTVYYAISLTILIIYSWKINKPDIGLCPFLSMAFGDGLACIIGESIKSPYMIIFGGKKSLAGSLSMLFVSILLFGIYFWYYNIKLWIIKSIFIGICSMVLEAFSPYGTDNLTVPLCDLFIISLLI